ncbi:hypothetical protein ACOME3_004924 [Neoechinorhynchus agilis]
MKSPSRKLVENQIVKLKTELAAVNEEGKYYKLRVRDAERVIGEQNERYSKPSRINMQPTLEAITKHFKRLQVSRKDELEETENKRRELLSNVIRCDQRVWNDLLKQRLITITSEIEKRQMMMRDLREADRENEAVIAEIYSRIPQVFEEARCQAENIYKSHKKRIEAIGDLLVAHVQNMFSDLNEDKKQAAMSTIERSAEIRNKISSLKTKQQANMEVHIEQMKETLRTKRIEARSLEVSNERTKELIRSLPSDFENEQSILTLSHDNAVLRDLIKDFVVQKSSMSERGTDEYSYPQISEINENLITNLNKKDFIDISKDIKRLSNPKDVRRGLSEHEKRRIEKVLSETPMKNEDRNPADDLDENAYRTILIELGNSHKKHLRMLKMVECASIENAEFKNIDFNVHRNIVIACKNALLKNVKMSES